MAPSSSSQEPLFCPYVTFVCTAAAVVVGLRLQKKKKKYNKSSATATTSSSTMSKHAIFQLRQKYFCKAVSISYANSNPLLIVQGKGSKLIDENGVEYLDTRNNVAHIGHSHPAVVQAVQKQVGVLNTNTRYLHPHVTNLAEKLVQKLPDPLEVVFFVNSGSEANDLALRLARAYSGVSNTIVVEGSYHGHTCAVLEVSPYKYEHSKEFDLQPNGPYKTPGSHIWKVPAPDIYRGPHTDPHTAGKDYARYVVEACQHYGQGNVSAFIVEGGMSIPGVILPPPGYLQHSVAAVRAAGGLYIADEVQTGFGRFGSSFWAFQHSNNNDDDDSLEAVVPDIVTMGKPFGNGMPLAACVTTKQVAAAFESMGVEYFNTFGGNPVCAAAGLAVLETMEKEHLQQHALEVGHYLKNLFLSLQETTTKGDDNKRLLFIGDVRGSGLFLGVELVRDPATKEPATEETSFVCSILKEKYKILTSIDGLHENVLIIKPPLCFSRQDCDYFVQSFKLSVMEDLAAAGDIHSLAKTPT